MIQSYDDFKRVMSKSAEEDGTIGQYKRYTEELSEFCAKHPEQYQEYLEMAQREYKRQYEAEHKQPDYV